MSHAYTEHEVVEEPALGLFPKIDWQWVSALDQEFGIRGALGRETIVGALCTCRPDLIRFVNGLPPLSPLLH